MGEKEPKELFENFIPGAPVLGRRGAVAGKMECERGFSENVLPNAIICYFYFSKWSRIFFFFSFLLFSTFRALSAWLWCTAM